MKAFHPWTRYGRQLRLPIEPARPLSAIEYAIARTARRFADRINAGEALDTNELDTAIAAIGFVLRRALKEPQAPETVALIRAAARTIGVDIPYRQPAASEIQEAEKQLFQKITGEPANPQNLRKAGLKPNRYQVP